jgi:hypothetical protein
VYTIKYFLASIYQNFAFILGYCLNLDSKVALSNSFCVKLIVVMVVFVSKMLKKSTMSFAETPTFCNERARSDLFWVAASANFTTVFPILFPSRVSLVICMCAKKDLTVAKFCYLILKGT